MNEGYIDADGIGRIPLRARDGSVRAWALVDAADFGRLNRWRWHLTTRGYVSRNLPGGAVVYMHRALLGLGPGDRRQGDHEDLNKLNNRRSNLRMGTSAQNKQNLGLQRRNTSGYRGVSPHRDRWRASAQLNGVKRNLGDFSTPEEAAEVAAAFRAEHMPFSEDARLAA